MKITWYGHACFLAETAQGSAVFDPYAPGSVPGLKLPELQADLVLCSHGHSDHNYAEGVTRSGREAAFTLRRVDCFHDGLKGVLRGKNTIHVIEAEGLRLAHLGDLGHPLSDEQLVRLGAVDILLIPVGGHFTIGAETAARLARQIGARITVPMHYRGKGFGYGVIGPVSDFTARMDRVLELDDNVLRPEEIEGEATVVLRCPTEG